MKKFVSKFVAAATLSLAMVFGSAVAFAGTGAVSASASSKAPKAGEKVSFTITFAAEEKIAGVQGHVAASDNLVFDQASISLKGAGEARADAFADAVNRNGAKETVTVTYTYTVKEDAKEGEPVSFKATSLQAFNGDAADITLSASSVEASAKVGAAAATDPEETQKPDQTPGGTQTPGDAQKPADDSGKDDVPKTGDASMPVWPFAAAIVLAGAGAAAVAKRKSVQR